MRWLYNGGPDAAAAVAHTHLNYMLVCRTLPMPIAFCVGKAQFLPIDTPLACYSAHTTLLKSHL